MQLLQLLTIQNSYLHYLQYNAVTPMAHNTIQLLSPLTTLKQLPALFTIVTTATYNTITVTNILPIYIIQYDEFQYFNC